jgi:putative NADH-flavin reductase
MKVLVLGSTGQTGYQVVKQLLKNGIQVKAIARNTDKFKTIETNKNLQVIQESILNVDDNKLKEILADIDITVSCLGHNISFKGIFGKPHYLVTEAIKKVIKNDNKKDKLRKLILMNTTACLSTDHKEKFSPGEGIVMALMRFFLPPQRDNEQAVKFLNSNYKRNNKFEWIAVRPDMLVNEDPVTQYELFESPQRSPVFNAGKTSRINVANFMMKLVKDEELWNTWKYKMPVIYNVDKK